MEKNKLQALVEEHVKQRKQLEAEIDQLYKLLGVSLDNGVLNTAYKIIEAYTNHLDNEYGGGEGWINWFIYDNKYGADNSVVTETVDGKKVEYVISTVADLIPHMISSQEYAEKQKEGEA